MAHLDVNGIVEEGEIVEGYYSSESDSDCEATGDLYVFLRRPAEAMPTREGDGIEWEDGRPAKRACLRSPPSSSEASDCTTNGDQQAQSAPGTPAPSRGDAPVQVYLCHRCSNCEEFASLKALHEHLRVHERANEEQGRPVAIGGWGVCGKRGRSGHDGKEEASSKAVAMAIVVAVPTVAEKVVTERADPPETRTVVQGREFACPTCGKTFGTHQALGGHVAGHKNKEKLAAAGYGNGNADAGAGRARAKAPKEHRCKECGKEFPTGVALGGHMRMHWAGPPLGQKRQAKNLSLSLAPVKKEASAVPGSLRLFGVDICVAGAATTQGSAPSESKATVEPVGTM